MQTTSDGYKQPIVYNDVEHGLESISLANNYFEGTAKGNSAKSDSDSRSISSLTIVQIMHDRASTSAYNSYSGHNETRYRCQTCMCDNGIVMTFTMAPHLV